MEQANDVDEVSKKRIIGLRLRQERKSRGWSQATLAEQMQTSVMNINRWENGKVLPQPHHRERLGTLFKKNIADLFEDAVTLVADDQQAPQAFPLPLLLEKSFSGDQNRQRLLEKVYVIWIKGLLEQSLQEVAYIKPGLCERSEAVTSPWKLSLQDLHQPDYPLPPDVSIDKAYTDAGQELLILGEPGSGKTLLLLELARILLERARHDELQPMPVILNLSSWTSRRQPIARWLVEELSIKYQVPRELGLSWVQHGQILPLLDGLDEVAPQYRNLCVDAINNYRQDYGLVPLVVCSRNAEYCNLAKHLHLQNAVAVQPLTPQQIDDYLIHGGKSLEPVHRVLHDDGELRAMVVTPLMLKILIVTYRDQAITDLPAGGSLAARRQRIFKAYVEHMLQRRGHTRYTPQKTAHWLCWLAHQLDRHEQSAFSIEQIQPVTVPQWSLRQLRTSVVHSMLFGTGYGLLIDIYWQLKSQPQMLSFNKFLPCLLFGFCIGILTGLLTVLVQALARTKLVAECSRSKHAMRNSVLLAIVSWLLVGSLLGVAYSIILYQSFHAFNIPYKAYESFFIRESGLSIGLTYGLLVGTFLWLRSGGMVYIQHHLLRIILWRAGSIPWNYPDFLDEATERILLRKVDGKYTFAHQLLREYFHTL